MKLAKLSADIGRGVGLVLLTAGVVQVVLITLSANWLMALYLLFLLEAGTLLFPVMGYFDPKNQRKYAKIQRAFGTALLLFINIYIVSYVLKRVSESSSFVILSGLVIAIFSRFFTSPNWMRSKNNIRNMRIWFCASVGLVYLQFLYLSEIDILAFVLIFIILVWGMIRLLGLLLYVRL